MDNNPEDTKNSRWAEEQFIQPDDIQLSDPETADKPIEAPLLEAVGYVAVINLELEPVKGVDTTTADAPYQVSEDNRSAISMYLDTIGRVPLLTAVDERDLARSIEKGTAAAVTLFGVNMTDQQRKEFQKEVLLGAQAKDTFIRSNLRLVVSIAKRFSIPHGMELLDIIQEGNLGLEHAVDKFDWRRGFKFSTYATFWIRQSIGRAIDIKANLIRLPIEISAALKDANKLAALKLANTFAASDENEENDNIKHLRILTNPISLNKKASLDGVAEIGDLLAGNDDNSPENVILKNADADLAKELLSKLSPRTRDAFELHYGFNNNIPMGYAAVGRVLGITTRDARRLILHGIEQIKNRLITSPALDNWDDL